MAFKCDNCGKARLMGNRVSHAKNRSRHSFKPNIQSKKVEVNGVMRRMKLCTNCIKLLNKKSKKVSAKFASLQDNHSENQIAA